MAEPPEWAMLVPDLHFAVQFFLVLSMLLCWVCSFRKTLQKIHNYNSATYTWSHAEVVPRKDTSHNLTGGAKRCKPKKQPPPIAVL
jgi:hypothetical protein